MPIENFNHTMDIWLKDLEQTSFDRICAKPSKDSWSLGQVCMHLIHETSYYLEQIKICLSTDDNAMKEMSPNAKIMFRNNDFPNKLIEGPSTNSNTAQPYSKEQLISDLMNLKEQINIAQTLISTSSSKGKTKHPGLNYFNANEWLQFAEMHFRHHLRQKKRIEDFLKVNRM